MGFVNAYVRGWQPVLTLPILAGVAIIMGKVLRGGSIADVFGVYSLAFWYGNSLVPTVMQSGTVLNVIFAIIIGVFSLGNAAPNISSIGAAMGSATIIYDTIERKSPIDPLSDEGIKLTKVEGLFKFKNIDFLYPTRTDVPVLIDFNLVVKPGTTVALVGSSGSENPLLSN
jgi:ATP-binding cassette subfamily B (MDR/TAP) protein 1